MKFIIEYCLSYIVFANNKNKDDYHNIMHYVEDNYSITIYHY